MWTVRFDVWKWVLRLGGLAIVLNEAFREASDRPFLYVIAAGMMGLSVTIPAELRKRGE